MNQKNLTCPDCERTTFEFKMKIGEVMTWSNVICVCGHKIEVDSRTGIVIDRNKAKSDKKKLRALLTRNR